MYFFPTLGIAGFGLLGWRFSAQFNVSVCLSVCLSVSERACGQTLSLTNGQWLKSDSIEIYGGRGAPSKELRQLCVDVLGFVCADSLQKMFLFCLGKQNHNKLI